MTTLTRAPRTTPPEEAGLTRWSLVMVPTFIVVYFATSFIGLYLIFPLLGLSEGDLILFARNVSGWAIAVLLWLLLAAAPVAGVVLAARALRRGGRVGAWTGLVVNAALVLIVAYMIFDEIRMTYFPQMTFPFPS